MEPEIKLDSCFKASTDIVAREIMGKILIVPLISGIGDMEDEIFTLNETGKAIWDRLSRGESVRAVIVALSEEYASDADEIERDVKGLMNELVKRGMLEEVRND